MSLLVSLYNCTYQAERCTKSQFTYRCETGLACPFQRNYKRQAFKTSTLSIPQLRTQPGTFCYVRIGTFSSSFFRILCHVIVQVLVIMYEGTAEQFDRKYISTYLDFAFPELTTNKITSQNFHNPEIINLNFVSITMIQVQKNIQYFIYIVTKSNEHH